MKDEKDKEKPKPKPPEPKPTPPLEPPDGGDDDGVPEPPGDEGNQ